MSVASMIQKAVRAAARMREREDFLVSVIAACALLLFLATGSRTMAAAAAGLFGGAARLDHVSAVSLLLNVALILFAWRRHKQAVAAMREKAAAEIRANLFRSRDLDTELLNRHSLKDRGDELICQADAKGGGAALMVVNLIRFKKINELHGEPVGDAVLRTVAEILLNAAPEDSLCARLGADEFAVAASFAPGGEAAIGRLAERLQEVLGLPLEVDGVAVEARAAIGLSRLEADCINFSALLRRADLAMNVARAAGGKRPVWFEARMERAVRARHAVENGLKRGIPRGDFVPYYQPLVEIQTGEIKGMEMLARWRHPTAGIVGPEVFIPIAEEIGLIGELSEALMRTAFLDAKRWNPGLTLSVNISPRQLAEPWFAEKILRLLAETGFPAGRLELEITESSLFQDLPLAQSLVASLKSHGIRLALDDFGTGYSSLSHLRALPFDRIKIDRSFILSLNKEPESWSIVRTIVSLAETMGTPITAEGVESGALELRLRELRCELGQGWFFGVPLPADETELLLRQHGLLAPTTDTAGPVGVAA